MFIEERFKQDDVNCYKVVDDSGIEIAYTYRGLYDKDVLEGLIAAGYKILDYHGHILTPDGVSIEDIALSNNVLNENEIHMMKELDVFALTEAEATEYFTRDIQESIIELKKPNITIHSREELIDYLNNFSRLDRVGMADEDCLPLNSFVDSSALFTFEEIQTDSTVQFYMRLIERRRELKSFSAYKKLVAFLQQEGVLKDKFTSDELKHAYASWGICGIKTMITQMNDVMGVTGNILLEQADIKGGNMICYDLMDKSGRIHSLSGVYDIAEEDDFNNLDTRPVDERGYYDLLRRSRSWDSSFQVVRCTETRRKTRTLMTLIDDSGVTYKAKFEDSMIVINTARGSVLSQVYLRFRAYNDMQVPISTVVKYSDRFDDWCLCCVKAHDLARNATVQSDVSSSYELFESEGMNKKAILEYMARRIDDDSSRLLNPGFDPDVQLFNAAKYYSGDIPKKYIDKYNPAGIEYSDIDELIDIMLNTKEDLVAKNEYLLVDESNPIAKMLSKEERELRVIEQLEFAKDVLDGEVSIDYLSKGIREDGAVDYLAVTNLLMLCYDKFGGNKTMQEYLAHITESVDDVDICSIFKLRNHAFMGAVKDTAILNELKATESVLAVYVTRVFREMSNAPISEQRHYAFECVALDLSEKKKNRLVYIQNEIANTIEEVVSNLGYEYYLKQALITEKHALALDIIFRIKFGNVEMRDDGTNMFFKIKHILRTDKVEFEIPISADFVEDIISPEYWRITFCTLNDWCQYEQAGGYFKLCCLNANIDPWCVTPKRGFKLNSYNFAINYLSESSYGRIDSNLHDRCEAVGAKVAVLRDNAGSMLIPNTTGSEFVEYTLDNLEENLNNKKFMESMDQYYKRFVLQNKNAIANGKMLYKMRTKSDIVLANFNVKGSNVYMPADADIYIEDDADAEKHKFWNRGIDVVPLQDDTANRISDGRNDLSIFDIDEEPYIDVSRWPELLNDSFRPSAILAVYGSMCIYATDSAQEKLALKGLTATQCDEFVDKGVFYKLSAREYLIKASNGSYKLEVK